MKILKRFLKSKLPYVLIALCLLKEFGNIIFAFLVFAFIIYLLVSPSKKRRNPKDYYDL